MTTSPSTRIPLLLLACSLAAVAATSTDSLAQVRKPVAANAPEPRTIDVIARRYAFEPSEIVVKVGEPVRLSVRSGDGLHGIEIKKLKINKEIPRGGEAVIIDFTPKAAGRYPIMCSEYCGDDHESMKGMLIVEARDNEVH